MRESKPIRTSASNIYKKLEIMKNEATVYANKTTLLKHYAKDCSVLGISAYISAVGDYLEKNNLIKNRGIGVCIDGLLNQELIYTELIDYVDRQDRTKPKNKTKIRRNKHKGTVLLPEKKLIPITNNVKQIIEKIGIENIVKSLRNDFKLEVIAKQVTIKEY